MNEEQARKLIQDGLNEKVQPLINNMAKLISDAYEAGIEVGFKIAKGN